jgi:hypothetical protein
MALDRMALDRTSRSKVFAYTRSNFETLFTRLKVLLIIWSSVFTRSNGISTVFSLDRMSKNVLKT